MATSPAPEAPPGGIAPSGTGKPRRQRGRDLDKGKPKRLRRAAPGAEGAEAEAAGPDAAAPVARPAKPVPAAVAEDGTEEKGPLRRCLVTRERLPKEAMIRFVLAPDGELVPDLDGRLPGRGMWLSAKADVLERAATRGAFAKAARGAVHLPPDLRAKIEDGLRQRVRDRIGFARRAGQAVCGWHAVREWMQTGRVALLVEAADGSANERARLLGSRDLPVVSPLTAAELGGIFGRDHAVHAAVAPGKLAETIAAEAARLHGLAADGRAGKPMDGPRRRRGPGME